MSELNEYLYHNPRNLPVILLLDTSGSMYENGKIAILNAAVNDMLDSFRKNDSTNVVISVCIYTFGGEAKLYQELKPAYEVNPVNMTAGGMTPLGPVLNMAKDMIEDKEIITSRSYKPVVILVSDGKPNGDWQEPLRRFKEDGRTAKCFRMAMGIGITEGSDNYRMLKSFVNEGQKVFSTSDAGDIERFFKYVTISVITRSNSVNPNECATDDFDEFLF